MQFEYQANEGRIYVYEVRKTQQIYTVRSKCFKADFLKIEDT
jgi:hypothetical protein